MNEKRQVGPQLVVQRIPPGLREAFARVCKLKGRPMREVLIEHMEQYVKRNGLVKGKR